METMTRDERADALDKFAMATPQAEAVNLPSVAAINNSAPAIIGSQPIAGRYRDTGQVLREIKVLAAAAGEDWFYRYPVKNKRENRTDWIEGPSIKLAMAVMGIVGNIEVDTRVQDFGSTFMIYARAVDLEKGSAVTRAFQQNKSAAKIGGSDDGRRNDMALQIGQSKAIRNAVVALLETYTDFAFAEAKNSLVARIGSDIVQWRQRVVERLGAKIDIKRVEAVIGRAADQWLAPDVARIIALGKAVEEGFATMDETFPPLKPNPATVDEKVESFVADERAMMKNNEIDDVGPTDTGTEPAGVVEKAAEPTANPGSAAQRIAISTALRLANNTQLTEQEKLEQLEQLEPLLVDEEIPGGFIKTVLKTSADVAKGKLKIDDARRYLEGMVK